MQPRQTAALFASGRIALGVALLTAPERSAHGWIGDDVSKDLPRFLVQSVGVRDLLAGLGTLLALRRGGDARRWIHASIAADVADTMLTLANFGALPSPGRYGTVALTAASAAAGIVLAGRIDAEAAACGPRADAQGCSSQ